MDQGFRRGFTTAEKTELLDRWQRGESLKAIGWAFGKPSSSIYFQVSPYGGKPQQSDLTPVLRRSVEPAPRKRTLSSRTAMSVSCQNRTHAMQPEKPIR